MRIVFAANWWYRRGGLGAVMLDEAAELERRGHAVVPFAAAHSDNLVTEWSRYFPPFYETARLGAETSLSARAAMAVRLVHNAAAARAFERLIDAARPDVIHVHNASRQLSPSILGVAAERDIPVVMTQHDYSLVCPEGKLLRGDAVRCYPAGCGGGVPVPLLTSRCLRRSLAASAVAAVEYGVHRAAGAYTRRPALLLAPSRFLERTLLGAGIPRRRLRYLPNGVGGGETPPPVPEAGGFVLYAGRLAFEKGLDDLMGAAWRVPEVAIVVAGDGPELPKLSAAAPPSVRFAGLLPPDDLRRLRAEAVCVVSPSIWFENAPISVLEAMRDGRATIASDLGGLPELVARDSGVLVPPHDPGALASAIASLWSDRRLADGLGRAARRRFLASFTLERHVDALEAIYREVTAA